jgi:hypothetical protein
MDHIKELTGRPCVLRDAPCGALLSMRYVVDGIKELASS